MKRREEKIRRAEQARRRAEQAARAEAARIAALTPTQLGIETAGKVSMGVINGLFYATVAVAGLVVGAVVVDAAAEVALKTVNSLSADEGEEPAVVPNLRDN